MRDAAERLAIVIDLKENKLDVRKVPRGR